MERKFSCLIVDDEPIARTILKSYLEQLPMLHLAGECRNVSEAYQMLCEVQIDVIFLDIQMPDVTGTAFLRSLREMPAVVFTTAYPEYAVEGFELNAVDYLLKPITFERFSQAVEKLRRRLGATSDMNTATDPTADYIFIKQNRKLIRVNFDEIVFIQAERDFCSVFLTDGKRLIVGMHLKLIMDTLPSKMFIRIHRSFVVNLKKVKTVQGNIIEVDGREIPVGNSYKEALFKLLGLE